MPVFRNRHVEVLLPQAAGPTTITGAGAASSTSTATADAIKILVGAGSATSTSTATVSATSTLTASGAATSASTATASAVKVLVAAGSATSTSTATATAVITVAGAGAATSVSTATADAIKVLPAAGVSTSVSTATATADVATGYEAKILTTAGLVSYWRFGEPSGTNANDEFGNNDGTLNAGATFGSSGVISGDTALSLDGSSAGNVGFSNPGLTAPFSLEAWVYITGPGDLTPAEEWANVFGYAGNRRLLVDTFGENGWRVLAQMGGTDPMTGPGVISQNAWYHIVYTYGASTEKIYVNGVERASVSAASGPTWNSAFFIGSTANPAGSYAFKGKIDEPAIYNVALSGSIILEHYQAAITTITGAGTATSVSTATATAVKISIADGTATSVSIATATAEKVVPGAGTASSISTATATADVATGYEAKILSTSGLVSYWRFGEPSGTSANDEFGNNDGTLSSGATFGATGVLGGDTAVALDGSSAGNVGFANPGLTGDFSLEAWAYITGPGDLVPAEEWAAVFGYAVNRRLLVDTFGENGWRVLAQMGGTDPMTGTGVISQNAWYHIVYTYGSGLEKIYVNGVEQASVSAASGPTWNSAFFIGSTANPAGSYAFKGKIDEAAIYNVALASATVLQHYQAASLPITGAGVATSTSTATATANIVLAGAGVAASTSSATTTATKVLVGAAVSTAVSTATTTAVKSLIGAGVATSASTATANALKVFVSAGAASSSSTATASAIKYLIGAGVSNGISTATANALSYLVGAAVASSSSTATANAIKLLISSALSASASTATATAEIILGDIIPPVPNITVAPNKNRISRISGQDVTTFTIQSDEAYTEYKLKVVPSGVSPHTAGTLIETSTGVFPASTNHNLDVTDDELVDAGLSEGDHIVKVFLKDAAGNWST